MFTALKIIMVSIAVLFFINTSIYAQSDTPQTWLGEAPFCTAKANDCSVFGMSFLKFSDRGDGNRCIVGNKVLCKVPKKTLKHAMADANNQFNVLSYNIFDRPFIVSHDGQLERTCRVPGEIFKQIGANHHIDIMVIQEAFTNGCNPGSELRTLFAYYGFPYSTATVDKSTSLSNGGIFIVSKWPIEFSEQQVFKSCTGSDCLAAKGVVYARINKKVANQKSTITYHVFGTHFNAWEGKKQVKIRLEQAGEVMALINKQRILTTEAVIIAGDLNVDKLAGADSQSELTGVLNAMHGGIPEMIGDQYLTTDPVNNPLALKSESTPQWLDYVLYSTQHLKPIESSLQSIVLHAAKPFKACMEAKLQFDYVYPASSWCNKTTPLVDLSDHYPVLGKFKY